MKKFVKGMFKDSERVDQPDSTYRDALNANLYYQKGAIVNEEGNKLVADVNPSIVNIIGQCPLEDGRMVLFAIDAFDHVISIVSPDLGTYKVLYRNDALNFQPDHTIEATAKVDTQGDILVYFTDNYLVNAVEPNTGIEYIDDYNPPRVFNISKQERALETSSANILYGETEYTVEKLDLFLNAGVIPQFDEVRIEDGGGVVSGTYHLALAYSDEDGNRTNFLGTSNAVHLVTAPENTIPTETITGDPQGSQSKKSITWEVTIPAQVNYSHVTPVIIQRLGGGLNQQSSEFAYELRDVKIPEYTGVARQMLISYTGLETVAADDVQNVVVNNVRYESAKTLVQLNNQLYLSNLKSRGDIGYQRFANAIQLDAVSEKIERFDPRYFDVFSLNTGYSFFKKPAGSVDYTIDSKLEEYIDTQSVDSYVDQVQRDKFSGTTRKGYKDPKLFYKKKSYRRSEVYAFYISFVLKDGTETYAYHIPGRQALEISDGVYENADLSVFPLPNTPATTFDPEELKEKYSDSKIYQVTDTQLLTTFDEPTTNFWENENEFYPNTEDFEIWTTSVLGNPVQFGSIKNQNVRHHKMPSNKDMRFKFIGDSGDSIDNFEPTIFNNDDSGDQKFKMFEDINILGIKLSNVRIPKFILRQVQGYKVYYAKRTQANKTVLGQSLTVPAEFRGNVVVTMDRDLAAKSPYHRAWMMYGGIPPVLNTYPKVDKGNHNYRAISVFGFHDFNLLKNKHTLTSASHIDIQSVLVMKHYRGGPGALPNLQTTNPNLRDFYMPEWLSSEIGNITDPDDGNSLSDSLKIKTFVTSVMMAAAYYSPEDIQEPQFNLFSYEEGGLSNTNSVYALAPKSITYLPGSTILEPGDATAYHGVKYLYNFAGESEIAIGLESGPPALKGWASNSEVLTEASGSVDWFEQLRFTWYRPNGYYGNHTPKDASLSQGFTSPQTIIDGDTFQYGGWPATYLINLCSIKSDVYKSFDEQQLVWTGYYKDLSEVDPETGGIPKENYFNGAESDVIFGGDTYIGRYSFRSTSLSYGQSTFKWFDIPLNMYTGNSGSVDVTPEIAPYMLAQMTGLNIDQLEELPQGLYSKPWSYPQAWSRGTNSPISTVFYFMCESDDLLGYRHIGDQEAGVSTKDSAFFDAVTAREAIFAGPLYDKTKMDNLLYMNNYSLNQDIQVALPYPKKLNNVTSFPTRTIRSLDDEGSINDKYRIFQALEFKDLPRNRGDIFKLFTLGSILYLHTERSLFVTRGKQQLELGDNTQAYVGSGNIFEQDPDELIPTTAGYGGCDSQFTALTTRFGQFFFNRRDKKAYLFTEGITEVSSLGMEKWFLDNSAYKIEEFGIDLEAAGFNPDAPTSDFGYVATYDSKYKRIILTKREKVPTELLNSGVSNGLITVVDNQFYDTRTQSFISFTNTTYFVNGGWTLSYYPELGVWGSRHSYIPRLYASTAKNYYSLVNFSDVASTQVWEHSNSTAPGSFFGEVYNFEFEYVDNTSPGNSKVFSNIYYWADVVSISGRNYKELHKHTSTGFTEFYAYNTSQISGSPATINYLTNARRVDKVWYINEFRDMSRTTTLTTNELVTGIPNVQGEFTTGVVTNQDDVTMFLEEGVVNNNYINNNKSWFEQKRFVDHYLGVRLISDNSTNNLIYLYAAGTKHRQSFR